jgi:hypothetical protein
MRRPAASAIPSPGAAKERDFCFDRQSTPRRVATYRRHDVRESARPRQLIGLGSVMPPFFVFFQSQPYEENAMTAAVMMLCALATPDDHPEDILSGTRRAAVI